MSFAGGLLEEPGRFRNPDMVRLGLLLLMSS